MRQLPILAIFSASTLLSACTLLEKYGLSQQTPSTPIVSTPVQASDTTDFTQFVECEVLYIKDCVKRKSIEYKELRKVMTSAQLKSIDKVNITGDYQKLRNDPLSDEHSYRIEMMLNNASAYGIPLKSIEFIEGYENSWARITFRNRNHFVAFANKLSLSELKSNDDYREIGTDYRDSMGNTLPKLPYQIYDKHGTPYPSLPDGGGCWSGIGFDLRELYLYSGGGC